MCCLYSAYRSVRTLLDRTVRHLVPAAHRFALATRVDPTEVHGRRHKTAHPFCC